MKTKTVKNTKAIIRVSLAVMIIAVLAVLSSCGLTPARHNAAPGKTEGQTETQTDAQTEHTTSAGSLDFSEMPKEFSFSSVIGFWSDDFTLYDDGTFKGEFHDRDAGIGKLYFSTYDGKFGKPQRINDYSYSMKIEFLNVTNNKDAVNFGEDYKYIPVESPLRKDEEVIVFLPGTPFSELPEDCEQRLSYYSRHDYDDIIPDNRFVLYQNYEDNCVVYEGIA